LLRTAARLPERSIIFFVSMFEDGAGNTLIPIDVLDRLTPVARVPVYCWPEMTLGHGIVGGRLLSARDVARQTGELALQALRGEKVDSIRNSGSAPYVTEFDARQLRRWRIDEARLPPRSVVRFREETSWSRYRWRIIGAISLVAAQVALIFGLLVSDGRRARAEHALHESHDRIDDLARRVIIAHEEERKRIARELHDDVSQHAATLTIDLRGLQRELGDTGGSVPGHVAALYQSAAQLSDRIHHLSRDMHSATLDHLGLAGALEAYCEEFSAREEIDVRLGVQPGLEIPADVALCLYRVTQEALHNVAKHADAKAAYVTLIESSDSIELRVADEGRGFDAEQPGAGRGLGLVSMEERVTLLHGRLELRTRPGAGTELTAHIPRGVRAPERLLATQPLMAG